MISYRRFGARRQHLKRTHFLNEQVRFTLPPDFTPRPQYVATRYFSMSEPDVSSRRKRLAELCRIAAEIRERERA